MSPSNPDGTAWSGTVADLGKMVKSKYPGQYDDLDDADLGHRVKTKFPGAYDDYVEQQQPQGQNGLPPGVGAPPSPHNPQLIQPVDPLGKPMDPQLQQNVGNLVAHGQKENAPLDQIGQGVKQAWNAPDWDQRAQGVSTALRGGMQAAEGAGLAMGVANPVPAIAAIGTGMAAGYGAKKGAEAIGAGPGVQNLSGDVAGLLAGGLAGKKMGIRPETGQMLDPRNAALRAWNMHSDPFILDQMRNGNIKLDSGLSDLKAPFQAAYQPSDLHYDPHGYSNEAVLEALPKAKEPLLGAWQQWKNQRTGQTISGEPIVRATMQALKNDVADPRAQAILDEAIRKYGRNLTPDEWDAALVENNAELKSFYSRDKGVQAAAERAGADTLKSKALLKAQGDAMRQVYYPWLDPDNAGAGPMNIRSRLGALMSIEEGANANRSQIYTSHPLNAYEAATNIKLDPRAIGKSLLNNPEWLIKTALEQSPNPEQLPLPAQAWSSPQRRLGPGTAPFTQGTSVPDVLGRPDLRTGYRAGLLPQGSAGPQDFGQPATPLGPGPDTSYVRGPSAMTAPPGQRALPPATTRMVPPEGAVGPHPTTRPGPFVPQRGPSVSPAPAASPSAPTDRSGNSLAVQLGKQIWQSLGGPQ